MKLKPLFELVVIMPFLDDTPSLNDLIAKLSKQISSFHLIVIDDGSIESFIDVGFLDNYVQAWTQIKLNRNSGAQRAIAVGLNYALNNFDFKRVLIMDCDGEDDPATVPGLLEFHGSLLPVPDICVVTRQDRDNSLTFKLLYQLYKLFFWTYTGKRMNFGHYSILTKEAVTRVINYPQLWIHLGSTYLLSRIPIVRYPLSKGKRYYGKSRLNLTYLIEMGLRSIVAQSEFVIPRVVLTAACLFTGSLATSALGIILGNKSLTIIAVMTFFLAQALIAITTLIMLLPVSRNSGEYNSANFQSLIRYVSNSTSI